MPSKTSLTVNEKDAWNNLLDQIDKSFDKGKIKCEEVDNLASSIKTYKSCHVKRLNSGKKAK